MNPIPRRADVREPLPMPAVRPKLVSLDPSGRLQVVECADDATGLRLFAVYDGLAVLRLCATHEQSRVFVQGLLTQAQPIELRRQRAGDVADENSGGTALW